MIVVVVVDVCVFDGFSVKAKPKAAIHRRGAYVTFVRTKEI